MPLTETKSPQLTRIGAVPTHIGWAHPETGELLAHVKGLDPVALSEALEPVYRPNRRNTAFKGIALAVATNALEITITPTPGSGSQWAAGADESIASILYDFGDGNTNNKTVDLNLDEVHTYATAGTYFISATVTHEDGTVAETKEIVTVTE